MPIKIDKAVQEEVAKELAPLIRSSADIILPMS